MLLDEVDREPDKRVPRFARYADACNVYLRSRRSGERVREAGGQVTGPSLPGVRVSCFACARI